MKMGEGVTGWVAEHRSPVALSSNAACGFAFQNVSRADRGHVRGDSSVPLVNTARRSASINVHHRDKHEHTAEEISTHVLHRRTDGQRHRQEPAEEENARLTEETRR